MQLPDYPQPGKPIDSAWGRRVVDYMRSLTWQSSPGLKIKQESGGTTASVQIPASKKQETPTAPFTVIMQVKGYNKTLPLYQWGVLPGLVFKSLQPDDFEDFQTNSLFPNSTPASTDPAWKDMMINGYDMIWMTGTYDDSGTLLNLKIESWGNGDTFHADDAPWTSDQATVLDMSDNTESGPVGTTPAYFRFFRKPIAYSVPGASADAPPVITQLITQNQLLSASAVSGHSCFWPTAYDGGFTGF